MHKRLIAGFMFAVMLFSFIPYQHSAFASDELRVVAHLEAEAENLTYSDRLTKMQLDDASGGYALYIEKGTHATTVNDIQMTVNVEQAGRYAFFVRLKSPISYITYHTKIDGMGKAHFMSNVPTGKFIYFPVDSYYLTAGSHTITFTYRHGGYHIDSLVLATLAHDEMFDGGVYDYTKLSSNSYTAEQELPEVLANGTHPRLIIESSKIDEIKANLTHPENINRYNRLVEAAGKSYDNCLLNTAKLNNYNDSFLDYIEANAFLYALYKEPHTARKAIDGIRDYLATYRSAFSNLTESREAGNLVFRASLVYDWCYDSLTDDDKNFIINQCLLLFVASEHGRDGIHALNAYNSDHGEEYVLIKNMFGFAVATFDEIPYYFSNVYDRIVKEFVPSRNFRYEDSEFNPMGDDYGLFRSGADSFMSLILHNLGKSEFITSNQRMQAYQVLYRKNANGTSMRDGDCYSHPILSGYGAPSGHTALLFIQAMLGGDPYLKHEYMVMTANADSNRLRDTFVSDAMHLALNDVTLESKQKNDLPLSKYFGDKSGVMVARTSWEDGIASNTMSVSMKISENNMGSHSHSDSGHFYIYYKGPLALDSGVYEPTDVMNTTKNEHLNNYYRRTVAHNSVLIGGSGQRAVTDISTYESMSADTAYGEVLGKDFGTDLNKPDYTYLKGDLTEAYGTDVAEEYTRSFMFFNFFDEVYPGALVVFDKITSADEAAEKSWLLHSQNEPEIDSNRITIRNTTNYGYNGRLINDVLLPKENLSIEKISGYFVGDADYTVGKAHASGIGDESGNYRVEISSSVPEKTEYRLNVLQVSENDDSIVPLEAELIEADGFYGAKIKDRIALFSTVRDRITHDASFAFEGSGSFIITVDGLKEGTWSIYKDGEAYGSANVSDNGGVASFEGTEGSYTLFYEDESFNPKTLNILDNIRDNPDYISVYLKNGVIPDSNGVTTSNYVYIPHKPELSDGKIMIGAASIANVFDAQAQQDGNTLKLTNKSKNELTLYENSKLIIFDGIGYQTEVPSYTLADGTLYVQAEALGEVLGCSVKYNPLSDTLYFMPSTAFQNGFLELGSADDVLNCCVFAQTNIVAGTDGKTVSGKVNLYNYSGKPHSFRVYLAVYDNGELVGIAASGSELNVQSADTELEFETASISFAEGNEAKLFIWQSDGITPER